MKSARLDVCALRAQALDSAVRFYLGSGEFEVTRKDRLNRVLDLAERFELYIFGVGQDSAE